MDTFTPRASVGVSACLMGHPVRYDGRHKAHAFVTGPGRDHLELRPYCPEEAANLGTPRPPMNLRRTGAHDLRVIEIATSTDRTAPLDEAISARLRCHRLDGYILKSRSPSCGMDVDVSDANGDSSEERRAGVFASALLRRYPTIPTIEEHRLADGAQRRAFIRAVFARATFRSVVASAKPVSALMTFHERYKYLLMAQHEKALRKLGPKVARATPGNIAHTLTDYARVFFPAINTAASDSSHVNALQHMAGYLRGPAEDDVRREVQSTIEGVLAGAVDISVPTRIIAEQARRLSLTYLEHQVYLFPDAHEAALLDWQPAKMAPG